MSYYDDEIKKELDQGEEYTEREIASLLYYREGSKVLSDDVSQFHSTGQKKFIVENKFEAFLHQCIDRKYQIPNFKEYIYVVKQI